MSNPWIPVRDQSDIEHLMNRFGNFHDGCVREAHLWTDSWVAKNLAMNVPGGLDTRIRFRIQRQFRDPSVIEMMFEEVVIMHWVPTPDNCDSIILEASLLIREDLIYWSPDSNWNPDLPDRDNFAWIAAKKLSWREVDGLGEELLFGKTP